MKFLRNRGIVIVLAVFAVGLVFKNLFWPSISRRMSTRSVAKAPAKPGPAKPATTAQKSARPSTGLRASAAFAKVQSAVAGSTEAVVPRAPMDVQQAHAGARNWTSTPRRDPFHMRGGIKDGRSAREQLTLTGTLRQTASTLAVLNNQILSAGDSILGFKIESVEVDRVWVSGPNGRESVEFNYSVETPKDSAAKNTELSQRTPDEGASAN